VQHHLPLGPHILKKFQKSSPNLISTLKIDQGSDFSEFVSSGSTPPGARLSSSDLLARRRCAGRGVARYPSRT
jgi:hypothetical protein